MDRLASTIRPAVFIAVAFMAVPTLAADKKPNILVIWGDDIGYWNVSAYNRGMMGLPGTSKRKACEKEDVSMAELLKAQGLQYHRHSGGEGLSGMGG